MVKRLLLVSGNIGAGKTSITERLGQRLGWQTSYESVSDNPYLSDFYDDMKQWSFHLQVFFLGLQLRVVKGPVEHCRTDAQKRRHQCQGCEHQAPEQRVADHGWSRNR